MLCYCKKCGRITLFIIEAKLECDCCHSKVYPVPDEFLVGESKMVINKNLKQQFINEYTKAIFYFRLHSKIEILIIPRYESRR